MCMYTRLAQLESINNTTTDNKNNNKYRKVSDENELHIIRLDLNELVHALAQSYERAHFVLHFSVGCSTHFLCICMHV